MIISDIDRLGRYAEAIPMWDIVQAFLMRDDLSELAVGRHDLDGDRLYAIVAEDTPRDEIPKLEAHRTYIDVQLAVKGSFDIRWRPLSECVMEHKPYDLENDFLLMADEATFVVQCTPGIAAVFFPEDAHAPQPPLHFVKKIVIKVQLNCT